MGKTLLDTHAKPTRLHLKPRMVLIPIAVLGSRKDLLQTNEYWMWLFIPLAKLPETGIIRVSKDLFNRGIVFLRYIL